MRPMARLSVFRVGEMARMPLRYLLGLVVSVQRRRVEYHGFSRGRISSGVSALHRPSIGVKDSACDPVKAPYP